MECLEVRKSTLEVVWNQEDGLYPPGGDEWEPERAERKERKKRTAEAQRSLRGTQSNG